MAKNRITRTVLQGSKFEAAKNLIDATVSFEQGDLLFLDTTSHLIKKVTAEADSATLLGIARTSVVNGKLKSPYQGTDVDAAVAATEIPGPVHGVIAKLVAKTGDAFVPGQKVGLDAASGAYHVTTTVTTKPVGIYQGPAIASAVAGQEIEVLIEAAY